MADPLASVRKAGDRLRITAQLIDAGDGSHLWSESYDRDLEQVYLRDKDLGGRTIQRTPPDERQVPAVLRSSSTETTP